MSYITLQKNVFFHTVYETDMILAHEFFSNNLIYMFSKVFVATRNLCIGSKIISGVKMVLYKYNNVLFKNYENPCRTHLTFGLWVSLYLKNKTKMLKTCKNRRN